MTPEAQSTLTALVPQLVRLARAIADTPDEAEDLCQETLLRICRKFRDQTPVNAPGPYARTVLRNLHRQSLRERRPQSELTDDLLTVSSSVHSVLALNDLQIAIRQLPTDQAELIRLVLAGETSPAGLSRLTGLPEGTVMSRLARARKSLRSQMGMGAHEPVASILNQ